MWSPDGMRIAFMPERDGDWDIWVMNADGSEQVRLTRHPGDPAGWDTPIGWNWDPDWSPDGSRIAFVSTRDGGFQQEDVFVMNADGTGRSSSPTTRRWLAGLPGNRRCRDTSDGLPKELQADSDESPACDRGCLNR